MHVLLVCRSTRMLRVFFEFVSDACCVTQPGAPLDRDRAIPLHIGRRRKPGTVHGGQSLYSCLDRLQPLLPLDFQLHDLFLRIEKMGIRSESFLTHSTFPWGVDILILNFSARKALKAFDG